MSAVIGASRAVSTLGRAVVGRPLSDGENRVHNLQDAAQGPRGRRARIGVVVSAAVLGGGALVAATVAPVAPATSVLHPTAGRAGPASVPQASAEHPATSPARNRSGPSVADALQSSNWSGSFALRSQLGGARLLWTIPSARAASPTRYSSTWVGVDGFRNADLIQTGTEQDSDGTYFAWWEILPHAAVPILTSTGAFKTVRPGDRMGANVHKVSAGQWQIAIQDLTRHWSWSRDVSYSGPGTSAEWIEEAPTVGGKQSSPADVGTVHLAGTEIALPVTSGGRTTYHWTGTSLTAAHEIELVQNNKVLLKPSAPSATTGGQHFTVTYVGT